MKALFLDSVAGVAGDMFAAGFVDAGLVKTSELVELPAMLGLEGVTIDIARPLRAAIRTTHIDVRWKSESWKTSLSGCREPADAAAAPRHAHRHAHSEHHHSSEKPHWHTHYRNLDRFLARSKLDDGVKAFARAVFRLIAEAEADAHGTDLDAVAFHEVGAVDSIVDVVMAAYCVKKVGASLIYATPVKLGRGVVRFEHGTHAVPTPAAARLALGFPVASVPVAITRKSVELSTPTGLAILKCLAPGFVNETPAGVLRAQGLGSGAMDLGSYPNVFRVMLLDVDPARSPASAFPYEADTVTELVWNVDDETAERTAWVAEQLLARGALDVWTTPVIGKKGRAAFELHALCDPSSCLAHADWVLRTSSTFGLRHRKWDRLKLARRFEKRQTALGEVTYKVGSTTDGKFVKEKPEFEELRKCWEGAQESCESRAHCGAIAASNGL